MREKDPTEYNGWETYVAAKMHQNDTSFMPRSAALVLQASQDRDKAALDSLRDRLEEVEGQNSRMIGMLEALQREQSLMGEQLAGSGSGGVSSSPRKSSLKIEPLEGRRDRQVATRF